MTAATALTEEEIAGYIDSLEKSRVDAQTILAAVADRRLRRAAARDPGFWTDLAAGMRRLDEVLAGAIEIANAARSLQQENLMLRAGSDEDTVQ